MTTLNTVITTALLAHATFAASATPFSCDAYLGLNRYHTHVDLDRDSNLMTVTGQDGEIFRGHSVYGYSSRLKRDYYYLPYTFENRALELRIDNRGALFCTKVNECYSCD